MMTEYENKNPLVRRLANNKNIGHVFFYSVI